VEYGMERLKTHVKLGLVVREEPDGLRQYVHVSTGNYHNVTARLTKTSAFSVANQP
jgi:polyphosphate kinase